MIDQPTAKFKTLQIITLALPGGVILFLLETFLLNQDKFALMPDGSNDMITYIALAFGLIFSILSMIIFNSMLQKIDTAALVNKKLTKYIAAYIIRFALIEGAALFNVVAFLLNGCLLNAGMALALIALMLSTRPQRQKTIDDLKVYYPDTLE